MDSSELFQDLASFHRWVADLGDGELPDLDTFLRSVHAAVRAAGAAPIAGRLAGFFALALRTPPTPFDTAWSSLSHPDDRPERLVKSTRSAALHRDRKTLLESLAWHSAELRRHLEQGALESPYAGMGLVGRAGDSWYNFDTLAFLEGASEGLQARRRNDWTTDCTGWRLVREVIETGRIYE